MGAPECLGGYKQNKLHNEYNKLKSRLKIKILKIIIIIHAKNLQPSDNLFCSFDYV